MVRKEAGGIKETCDINIPLVYLLDDDIVSKLPAFQSKMPPGCLAAVRLLKVGVGDYMIELSANRKETQAVGSHASTTMMTQNNTKTS